MSAHAGPLLPDQLAVLGRVLDRMTTGVAVFDSAARFVTCNHAFSMLFSPCAPLLVPGTVYADLVVEQMALADDPDDRLALAALGLRPAPAEGLLKGPLLLGLKRQWWELEEQPSDDGGFVCLWTNVTRRLQAETEVVHLQGRLRDAIQSLPDGLALFDAADRLEIHNNGFAALYQVDMAEALSGASFADLLAELVDRGLYRPPLTAVESFADWTTRVLERHRRTEEPFEMQLTDGRWIRVVERRTGDGGIIGLHTDISQQKRREAELLAAKAEAEAAALAKNTFLNSMSHELRTPLNAIIGFSELIRDEAMGPIGSEQYRDFATDIFESGSMLLGMINDVLDMSRIEAGEHQLAHELIDFEALVGSCLGMLRSRALAAGVNLAFRPSRNPPTLVADRRVLMKILLNLLSNAVKFTPSGGQAWVTMEAGPDGAPRIIVKDTGIGIAADALPRVFEPFHQVDGALNRRHEGTGLGLAMCQALVTLLGGRIELESHPGVGTVVRVDLLPVHFSVR